MSYLTPSEAEHRLLDISVTRMRALCACCGEVQVKVNERRYVCGYTVNGPGDLKRTAQERQTTATSEERANKCLRRRAKHYGISEEDAISLLARQGGRCAICAGRLAPKLHLDHDHVSGRVRGVLCPHCNAGLGCFRDNIARLTAAITYLQHAGSCENLVNPRDDSSAHFRDNPEQKPEAGISQIPVQTGRRLSP